MKKIILLSTIIILVFSSLILTGCKEEGMSIDSRIEAFVSDLNDANRNGIFKEHFHSDSGVYSTGDEITINIVFPNGAGYSVTSISGSGSSRTVNISGDIYTFSMKEEDADDWYILSISPGALN